MEKATASPFTKKQWWMVLGVLLLAFFLRLMLVLSLAGDDPFFNEPIVDAGAYDKNAEIIAFHDFWGDRAFYQDPLYPYFLGVNYLIFGRDLVFIRIFQAFLATLGCLCLFETGRRLGGFWTGFAVLCLAAVAKSLVFYDVALLKEIFGVLFVEAALLCVVAAGDRWWVWLLAGLALGLGALVRGNVLLLIPVLAVWTRDWKQAGLVVGGGLLAILPVTIRNAAVDSFVLTTSQFGPNLYTGNNEHNTTGRYRPPPFVQAASPIYEEEGFRRKAESMTQRRMTPSEIDSFWRKQATRHIFDHFGTFLWVSIKRTMLLVNRYEIADNYSIYFYERYSFLLYGLLPFGVILPLAVVGIWIKGKEYSLLTVFLIAYAVSIIPFFVFARYRLPMMPMLLLFSGTAIVEVVKMWNHQMRALPRLAGLIFVVGLVLVHLPIQYVFDVGAMDTATSHMNVATLHLRRDQPEKAAKEMEAAFKIRPSLRDRRDATFLAGTAWARAGDVAEAVQYLNRASQLDDRNYLIKMELGKMYLRVGDSVAAAKAFASAVVREPRSLEAHLLLGRCYQKRQPDEAVRVWEQGWKMLPGAAQFPLEIMWLYSRLGDLRAARTYAEKVLRLVPDQPDAKQFR